MNVTLDNKWIMKYRKFFHSHKHIYNIYNLIVWREIEEGEIRETVEKLFLSLIKLYIKVRDKILNREGGDI